MVSHQSYIIYAMKISELMTCFIYALGFTQAPMAHIVELHWHMFVLHWLFFVLWASPKLHRLTLLSFNGMFLSFIGSCLCFGLHPSSIGSYCGASMAAYSWASLALRPWVRLLWASRCRCRASATFWILACFAAFAFASKLAMLGPWVCSMRMELPYNFCSGVGSAATSATNRRHGKRSSSELILSVLCF